MTKQTTSPIQIADKPNNDGEPRIITLKETKRKELLEKAQSVAEINCNVQSRVLKSIVNDAINSIM